MSSLCQIAFIVFILLSMTYNISLLTTYASLPNGQRSLQRHDIVIMCVLLVGVIVSAIGGMS